MNADELDRLKQKLNDAVARRASGASVAIVGWSPIAFEIAGMPVFAAGAAELAGIFGPRPGETVRPIAALRDLRPDIVVIAEDVGKEALLEEIALLVPPSTKLLIGGYAHFDFHDEIFYEAQRNPLIPAFANCYPHFLV